MARDFATSYQQAQWKFACDQHQRALDAIVLISGMKRITEEVRARQLAYYTRQRDDAEARYPGKLTH